MANGINPFPRTKYAHYNKHELLAMFDQCKEDPDYVLELKQRLEQTR
jgi:site-specific recombinase